MSAAALDGPPDAGPALEGTVLAGRYRILRRLGEGAMGAVYLGEHLRIGRRDAIKVLRESLAADPEAMARFARGARNVALIHHPNVCTVYDFGDLEDGRRFLAMEFVPGETLHDLLAREGRLPPARAVSIAVQVAGALQAAHEAGIVHRDLKPGNVMVSPGRGGADVVKVVDFDIAKGSAEGQAGDVTRLGFVIGTPEYMSPEQLLGMALDGRSDVYSLALVLFRMLAGSLPFRAHDTQELMVQRLTGTPLRLDEVLPAPHVPPAMQAALDRALQRRAEDRFAGAAEFADAIARAVAEPAAPGPSTVPADPDPRGWTGGAEETRGGIPATVLTADYAADRGPAPVPVDEPRPRSAFRAGRVAAVVAAAVVVLGGVWGVSRALAPPGGAAAAPGAPATGRPDASLASGATPAPPIAMPIATPGIVTAATDSAPAVSAPGDPPAVAASTDRAPESAAAKEAGRREPERRPEPRDEVPERRNPPVADPPTRRDGVTAATAPAILRGLKGRLGDPELSGDELAGIRRSAQAVWALGGALPARDRADAAFVLGMVAMKDEDWAGCVRWLERSNQLNPTAAARVLLDRCRENQA